MARCVGFGLLMAIGLSSFAATVTVVEQTVAGSVTNVLSTRYADTESLYTTATAPSVSGRRFMYWELSPAKAGFVNRDFWGRALDRVSFMPVDEVVTVSEVYGDSAADGDGDGIPDAQEMYWYGHLNCSGASDTDSDGLSFADELSMGTNPHFPDEMDPGGVVRLMGPVHLYNPNEIAPYILRCEPDGVLFATSTNYVKIGTAVSCASYSEKTSAFAYWTLNGARQQDVFGRARNGFTFVMPEGGAECVAVCSTDADARQKLYWFGNIDVAESSDTDGDGFTYAEELSMGTNPLFPDEFEPGGVSRAMGATHLYNPYEIAPYILRCEPEGALFATTTNYVEVGTLVSCPTYSEKTTSFAYWTLNGVRQEDAFGRARNGFAFAMMSGGAECVAVCTTDADARLKLYWFGNIDVADSSDTDGDGFTYAEELAMETNPLFPDELDAGGVARAMGAVHETNLQPFEQVGAAIVDGEREAIFKSDDEMTEGAAFGAGCVPAVVDFSGDGLWDFIVAGNVDGVWKVTAFRNIGSKEVVNFTVGADAQERVPPGFSALENALSGMERPMLCGGDGAIYFSNNGGVVFAFDCASGAVTATGLCGYPVWNAADGLGAFQADGITIIFADGSQAVCDTAAPGAVSAAFGLDNGAEVLLVALDDGRICCYAKTASGYTLKHRIWGGSYIGFASGLALAPVDWEDDGDLDCLCGTADGRLMLLRDPSVGRPVGLKAVASVDNVLLAWDPNAQSRVRGYKVYRGEAEEGAVSVRSRTDLPVYRDFPEETKPYWYRVSSVGRFYTAGNSTPRETESPMSEPVRAEMGKVNLWWNDAVAKVGGEAVVSLSIGNTMGLATNGLAFAIAYDANVLRLKKTVPSALLETAKIPAGQGKVMDYVFEVLASGATTTEVSLTSATLRTVGGASVAAVMPGANAVVTIEASANPPYVKGDVTGDGVVDEDDLRLLAKLKEGGRKWTQNQLKAGDFNGNGKIDNADYQALRALLNGKNNGNE